MPTQVKDGELKDKKAERNRSGSFPTLSLSDAIAIIKRGASAGWNSSKNTFAVAIGGKTHNSGAFIVKLAALRDYGLIERGGSVQYTQLARDIVAPASDNIQDKLRDAFLHSDTFRVLYEKIKDGSGEFNSAIIENSGINDFRVAFAKKDLFAQNFISSAKDAGLIVELGDSKYKIIAETEPNFNNAIAHTGVAQKFGSKNKMIGPISYTDSGDSWSITITSNFPISSKIKVKAIEIADLLEQKNDDAEA